MIQYGRVERVYIDRNGHPPANVFVKFTSQLSALRVSSRHGVHNRMLTSKQAVNALEGRIFNGNKISAMFYDTERFEQGVYD